MESAQPIFSSQRERVRLYFKIWSRFYDSAVFQAPFFALVHRRLLQRLEGVSPRAILDVGCGTGELLGHLARRFPEARLWGLDLSGEMLERAAAKLPAERTALVEGSVFDLPFEAGAFDLITNSISSHYYLDFDRAAAELARVSAPGGALLMASMTNGPLRFVPGPWQGEVAFWTSAYRSPAAQRERLERAGFEVGQVERVLGPVALYEGRRGQEARSRSSS